MSRNFIIIAILMVGAGAILGGIFGRLPGDASLDAKDKLTRDFQEALGVVGDNYVSPSKPEEVLEDSIQGMLWTLDPHSSFFTKTEFKKLYEDQSSRFYGIGVSILSHRDGTYVQSIVKGTPAEKAGLKYGDKFVEVDGKDAAKWGSQEVSKNVRGEKGSVVNIKIGRVGHEKPLDFEIVRDGVPLPSIRNHFMLKDDTGYIGLTGGFQETSSAELDEAMGNLRAQGMKQLVLDLRGNPGGLLPQAIEISSRFLPRGQVVVSVKGRGKNADSKDYRAIGGGDDDIPLVVMINGGSASASEIVAGALQDYGRAVLVGSDSFGKGLVQKVFPLPSGTGLTLTTQRYYTPYGRSLQKDYSSGSIYDYYTGSEEQEKPQDNADIKPKGIPVETANGKVYYGGRGIEPDIKAEALSITTLRYRLNESAFFFTRQLVSGKIDGFESFKNDKQRFEATLKKDDFQINEKLVEAFTSYTLKDKENGLKAENINSQLDYAKSRLREELATANYSSEAGTQVLLESDPQILKALDALPEAQKLAENFKSSSLIG
jgi:carboxyl-terminal processing protease